MTDGGGSSAARHQPLPKTMCGLSLTSTALFQLDLRRKISLYPLTSLAEGRLPETFGGWSGRLICI
jgi:hypothetical protein